MNESEDKYLVDRRFVRERQYNVKSLWDHHQQMLRLIALGRSNVEIAEAMDCTPQSVSNLRNSPVAKVKLEQLKRTLDEEAVDIGTRIQEFAPVALRLLEDVISGRDPDASISLRAKYASLHLSRAGFGEVKKVASINTHLTRDDIEDIKRRAVDAANDAGLLVSSDDESE
jgi:hypothetical protein